MTSLFLAWSLPGTVRGFGASPGLAPSSQWTLSVFGINLDMSSKRPFAHHGIQFFRSGVQWGGLRVANKAMWRVGWEFCS